MTKRPKYERIVINSLDEIPDFATEDEERDWWAAHEFSEESLESMPDMTAELDELFPLPDASRERRRTG